ncbi:MAG: alpha/beta hydrolase [Myxococcales bacterium]|nr:alpha/beta hydrolase [Myxococcales bacterium]MCB9714715.1 alpha/beta hydrolase [Myxococcales bacterium]
MRAPSRYLESADGTRIAYRVTGEGRPIVLANGLSTSDFFWQPLISRWLPRFRVITWDYKGHGESDPARTDFGTRISSLADDMRRVMDVTGTEKAVVLGFSMGCQVVLEAWRGHRERIAALGLVLGPAGRLFDTALRPLVGPSIQRLFRHVPAPWLPPVFGVAHRMARLPGSMTMGRWMRLYGRAAGNADLARYVEHFGRLDPRTLARIALQGGEHDARDVLPTIDVPTLVVTGDKDVFAPPRTVGLPIHAAIPGSRLLRLGEGTHLGLVEQAEPIGRAIEGLLADAGWR